MTTILALEVAKLTSAAETATWVGWGGTTEVVSLTAAWCLNMSGRWPFEMYMWRLPSPLGWAGMRPRLWRWEAGRGRAFVRHHPRRKQPRHEWATRNCLLGAGLWG
jgi:hypothetical protein